MPRATPLVASRRRRVKCFRTLTATARAQEDFGKAKTVVVGRQLCHVDEELAELRVAQLGHARHCRDQRVAGIKLIP